jgi:hypothetical protein
MARTERFGLGTRIDSLFLDFLESLRRAAYAPVALKLGILDDASRTVDAVRFFAQLAWEAKAIPNAHFALLGSSIEEVGRMVGGWRKGLAHKTPAIRTRERGE